MANVLHPHIDFHPRPVAHAPSPFGFGFGLGPSTSSSLMSSTGWGSSGTPGHTNPAAFHQLASSVTQSASMRPQKRRMSSEDDSEQPRNPAARDESMDRSPTPERPKHAAPKRARVVNVPSSSSKSDATGKNAKDSAGDDVDIGVLLASLPPQSLLPLMLALVKEQPTLKDRILPLIPRPTLETAIHTLAQSSKKLTDAVPYSAGAPNMRIEYIMSRLQPHISDYVSICLSYFPYFSCIPAPSQSSGPTPSTNPPSAIQATLRDKFYPTETFLFLHAVTSHILTQPAQVQSELLASLFPRLSEEWNMWVTRLDEQVNREARIMGSEVIKSWRRTLNTMASARSEKIAPMMKVVRDRWEGSVGWLHQEQQYQQAMDEHY